MLNLVRDIAMTGWWLVLGGAAWFLIFSVVLYAMKWTENTKPNIDWLGNPLKNKENKK